jgi:hypothetical protein
MLKSDLASRVGGIYLYAMSSGRQGVSRRSFVTGVSSALALGVPWELLRAEVVPTLSLLPFLARPTTCSILVT